METMISNNHLSRAERRRAERESRKQSFKPELLAIAASFDSIKTITDQIRERTGNDYIQVFDIMCTASFVALRSGFFVEYGDQIKENQKTPVGLCDNNRDGNWWIKFNILKEKGRYGVKDVELDVDSFEKHGFDYNACVQAANLFHLSMYLEYDPKTGELFNSKEHQEFRVKIA